MKTAKYLLLIILVCLTLETYPQDFWQQTNGPTGGVIKMITSNANGVLFATTPEIIDPILTRFGYDKLYRSTDDGQSWVQINNGLNHQFINKLVFNSQGDIFITAEGIFRSTDNGDSWVQINDGLSNLYIMDLIIALNGDMFAFSNDGTLFKSTNNGNNWMQVNIGDIRCLGIGPTGDLYAGSYGKIYLSTDNGNSWSTITNGISSSAFFSSISFDSAAFIYGSATSISGGELYRSSDNGNSWVVINNGLPLFEYSDKIVVNINHSLFVPIFYSGEIATVYRSSDNGNNWIQTTMNTYLYINNNLVVNSQGDIFCPDRNKGIFRSTDEGVNWIEINNGLDIKSPNSIHINTNDKLYAATKAGIFCSTNNGDNWTNINNNFIHSTINTLFPSDNNKMFAGTFYGGLYRSEDKGNNWVAINNGINFNGITDGFINDLIENSAGYLFAVAGYWDSGVFRSSDGGQNWDLSLDFNQTGSDYIGPLAVNSSGDVYAGTYGKLMRSVDNGVNWTEINLPFAREVNAIAVNPYGHIFAAAYTQGVYRSTDNGLNWSQLAPQIFNNWEKVLKINSDGIIFSGTHNGLFRSSDNGISWTQVTNFSVNAVTFNQDGFVFIGSDKVYRSTDDGNNWVEINTGLPADNIISLAVDADGYIYSGTMNYGVYRSLESTTSVEDENLNSPTNFTLEQNYPNPFNPSTRIQYQVSSSSNVSLKVYDVLGNEVATLVNEQKPAGSYEVNFNAAGLSSGIYFYKLKAGSLVETKKMILMK